MADWTKGRDCRHCRYILGTRGGACAGGPAQRRERDRCAAAGLFARRRVGARLWEALAQHAGCTIAYAAAGERLFGLDWRAVALVVGGDDSDPGGGHTADLRRQPPRPAQSMAAKMGRVP